MLPVEQPFKTYTGLDGKPLDDGYVYFGLPNQDPIAHPVTVYWDAAGTIPAAQPLRTVNGYVINAGTPANVFAGSAYSELVQDSKHRQVFYAVDSATFSFGSSLPGLDGAGSIGYGTTNVGALLKNSLGRVVSSIAALRTLDTTRHTQAFVTGYYAAGDGGGGAYFFDATDSSSLENGGTIILGSGGGCWKLLKGGVISVRTFGAKGDGATNDAPVIQSAINWRLAAGGGTLLLPAGNYLISTGLTWTGNNLVLTGEGKGATTITASFATGDIITVGDGTANPNNAVIQSLRITANVAKTTGAAIRFRNGHNLKARDIRLDSNLFKGIALDGGAQHFSYYVQDFEIGASSVGIEFGSDGTQVADVFVSTGIVSGATNGLLFRNASGVYASQIDMIGCADAGIAMIPADGQGITSSFFDTVLGDTAANQGWKIIPTGTGKVADIGFVNCWGSTTQNAAGAGLYIAGPANSVSNLHFTNFRAVNNAGSGILLAQGRFITFANCVATANSQSSSATYPGFSIVGTLTDIQITGGVYGGMNTLPQNQSYGISFGGACDYIQVLGANTRGNLTGGLINASSGTHNVVANNV